jgi:RimJ/RimL family protein N-acetyltransferase
MRMGLYRAEYVPLSAQSPDWGSIALLPWDEEIFGFPVADLRLGRLPEAGVQLDQFGLALDEFSARTKVRLISTRCGCQDNSQVGPLSKFGFSMVELSLDATLPRIKPKMLPAPRYPLRLATTTADREQVSAIAARAFTFGRYHTDPRFPKKLADLRYLRWVRNALNGSDPNNFVFVLGPPGGVIGFMDVVVGNGRGDLRLGAVDPERNTGFAGMSLYTETLRSLHEIGALSVTAKIAAANTRVMNIYAALGFQFSRPETVLHWHSKLFNTPLSNL